MHRVVSVQRHRSASPPLSKYSNASSKTSAAASTSSPLQGSVEAAKMEDAHLARLAEVLKAATVELNVELPIEDLSIFVCKYLNLLGASAATTEDGSVGSPGALKASPKALAEWTPDEVWAWAVGAANIPAEAAAILRSHGVTGRTLGALTELESAALGFTKFGWRRQLTLGVQAIIRSQNDIPEQERVGTATVPLPAAATTAPTGVNSAHHFTAWTAPALTSTTPQTASAQFSIAAQGMPGNSTTWTSPPRLASPPRVCRVIASPQNSPSPSPPMRQRQTPPSPPPAFALLNLQLQPQLQAQLTSRRR